jgi:hypothetical protein
VAAWRLVIGSLAVVLTAAGAGAQAPAAGGVARTPWGAPDLQGIWDYWTFTPLERPKEVDAERLTEAQAAELAQQAHERAIAGDRAPARPGDPGAYSQEVWTDRVRATALTQPALIVDPPDGRLPPLTPAAQKQAEAQRAGGGHPVRVRTGGAGTDGPEDRGVAERCILGFSTGPPMLPAGYNNNIQILQTPDYVVIHLEMNHDARIVPLDGRPHLSSDVRQWLGSSRGRWEGNTLVVETTNFTDKTASISLTGFAVGSAEHLRLVERFTRVDADTLMYEFTVNDPATFTRPFTGRFPMTLSDQRLYEYACHEGNYGMFNLLSGARAEERAAAGGAR